MAPTDDDAITAAPHGAAASTDAAAENRLLRKTLRDMVATATLPALWMGLGPGEIARSLSSALLTTLAIDVSYVRVGKPGAAGFTRAMKTKIPLDAESSASLERELDVLIDGPSREAAIVRDPTTGERWHFAVTRFGAQSHSGCVVTASRQQGFPSDLDRALLGISASQIGATLQGLHAENLLLESRANLDAALQAADLGHWRLLLADGSIARNLRHDRIFGYPAMLPAWNLATLLRHVVPEDRDLVEATRQRAIDTDSAWDVEFRIRRNDDALRWIWLKGKVVRDEQGRAAVLTGVLSDVTERKDTEEELRDARARLQAALRAGAIVTWTWDIPANRLWSDETLARLFGLEPTATAGGLLDRFVAAIHPDDRDRVTETLSHSVATLGDYAADYRIVHPDGSTRWVAARGQVECDAHGRPARMPGVLVDITDRKVLETQLIERASELARMHQRKDEFLATLAHELRNPLAPIRNSLQILKMPGVDERAAMQLRDIMDRQVQHLIRLVDDLLDVSRVMRGKIELRREPIDLADVVARAIETAQPVIDAQAHALSVDFPDEPIVLDADPIRLSQVVCNLLNNAARYMDPRGSISVSARRDGDTAVLSVSDRGIGIPGHMLPHVFDLFVQVDHSSGKSQGGLGIGLTLVKNLVGMHGGTVEVRSDGSGAGSEFIVRLPVAGSAAARVAASSSRSRSLVLDHEVLIVDDNVDGAHSLAMLLKLKGYRVHTVHDGASALAAVRERQPAVVLLDLGMPGMDGHEVARRLRTEHAVAQPVLVALTGWGQERDRIRTTESGFDHHLVKPVDLDALDGILAMAAESRAVR